MLRCRITVLKTMLNTGLAEEFCMNNIGTCPVFEEGQEFRAGLDKPEGFCDWAWNDILKYVAVILGGGDFSSGIFEGWMKIPGTMIACCTDGVRPVVFKLERIESDGE